MTTKRLYVGNLPYTATNDELRVFFEAKGKVVDAKVLMDRETGRSRGFGFVEMSTVEEAEAALSLDKQMLGGRDLNVREANERTPKSGGGGGGYRGGGGGGGGGDWGGGGGGGGRDRGGRRGRDRDRD